ncbi:hypothetical protein MKS88_003489 [Plasmodium brasilianum]|uniref:Fam-m protein n=2 Tax=Plasmodium (Plasmodium) TaxID=418103 RepID=A0A1D3SN91_PLAMA|nr:Plasmodium exported protein, unknown function [Plasmodium malariae]KAI4837022.1 hypothetical protein MKS88_003489 [Plasmodium brasilianum]SCO92896.1 Plasmodium exported protein, unknown function [Plasmodium malariae]
MENKINLFFFIKIAVIIFLIWIYRFNSEVSNFCKYLDKKDVIDEKLYTRNYRLLAKYKKEKYSNIVRTKEDILNNGYYEMKHICRNGKVSKKKNKLPKVSTSNSLGDYKQTEKSKFYEYNKVNTYNRKKMLDKIYYKNVLEYSKNADFRFIKKFIQRKNMAIFALYILHLAVGVLHVILFNFLTSSGKNVVDIMKMFIPLYILWFIILVRFFYNLRETGKYKNLLHLKSKMNYTE